MSDNMALRLIAERHQQDREDFRVAQVLRQVDPGLPFQASFKLAPVSGGTLVQVEAYHADSQHPTINRWWLGRQWFVPAGASTESIVCTALMAVETYMLHELRENFKFAGQVVFDPHKEVL